MAGTTTNYGWTYPTSTDLVKDGATAIQTATQGVDTTLFTALGGAYPGLRLVKKQTIGSAVASVTVTGAFSATYENYKIIISGGVSSADCYLRMQLGATATGYSGAMWYSTPYTATTLTIANDNSVAQFSYAGEGRGSQYLAMNLDLIGPFLTKYTRVATNFAYQTANGVGIYNGIQGSATSFTDFTISTNTGTITGGTIYVYGYGIS